MSAYTVIMKDAETGNWFYFPCKYADDEIIWINEGENYEM